MSKARHFQIECNVNGRAVTTPSRVSVIVRRLCPAQRSPSTVTKLQQSALRASSNNNNDELTINGLNNDAGSVISAETSLKGKIKLIQRHSDSETTYHKIKGKKKKKKYRKKYKKSKGIAFWSIRNNVKRTLKQ